MQYDESLFSDAPAPAAKMDESLFSSEPAPSGKSLGGLAHNAARDAGEIVQNTANLAGNMISHPIDTTSQVVKGLPTALKQWAGELGIPEALHGKFGEALSKFGNSAYEKPVSRALDVAAVAMPALKGAGILDAGAKGAELASEGGKIAEMAGDASNALGRRELGFSKRFINTGEKFDKANDATEWANKNGLMDVLDNPEDRLAKTKGLKDQAWNTMSDTYQNPALAGKKLNAQRLIDSMNEMRPKDATGKVLSGGEFDSLNAEIDKKIATIQAFQKKVIHPTVSPIGEMSAGMEHLEGDIPWQNAQELKNSMKGATKWELTQPSTINDLRKRLSGAFRGNMDTQLEEGIGKDAMGGYNAAKENYGMAKTIERGLDNKISSKAGNKIGGFTDWAAAAAGGAHGGPMGALAVVAGKKIMERYGMAAGSKILSQLAGGKYAGVFSHMAQFGPSEMATLNLIAEKDPQFAQELGAQQ